MITIASIKAATAASYGLAGEALESRSRLPRIVRCRHVAMHLSRHLTRQSLRQIGKSFGGRDHSTVFAAIRSVDHLCVINPAVRRRIYTLSGTFVAGALVAANQAEA